MAITQALCTSFKVDLLNGEMDFSGDTTQNFRIALFTSAATLGASTTTYTTASEAVGTGYTAGGQLISIAVAPTSSGTTAYLDFSDVTWSNSSITARGALIYQQTTNKAIAVLDFGADKISTDGDFVVQFPTADASNAIIRVG